ncbi:YcjF family protein [Lignipirellula cremea]|uniref:GTPase Era n=1 Tax=Lignipirellula cremea TaxID=2528010 RepID=A0A518DM29_9BACT|nr:GTP-binding protein [Lignipirellula cremea]QDU92881.1 GTPase Era [Lignipirellula cremea]
MTDDTYSDALASLEQTFAKMDGCSQAEKDRLAADVANLREMITKMTTGRVEIVLVGEISTGKSALINALVGDTVAGVDVQGGWTKELGPVAWGASNFVVPGLADSSVVLIDTPGLNEVGGADHADLAREAARRADLLLFVTDSDLNETEFTAITALASIHKPMLVVLNKMDLYSAKQRERLHEILAERLRNIVPSSDIVATTADPREVEYVIEGADGSSREEWRKPSQKVEQLKVRILEILEREGLALMALNAAMYASDKSDRIAAIRVQLRDRAATQTIWSYAAMKAVAVGVNPMPVVDILGGSAVDVTMVLTLSHIYGLEMSWKHARGLVTSILTAAGWVMAGEAVTSVLASMFKLATGVFGTLITALPQGAAAGFGSYIVGQAAKYYFEHGASWGGEAPKVVVGRILENTDKESVMNHLKEEIKKKISFNAHSDDAKS